VDSLRSPAACLLLAFCAGCVSTARLYNLDIGAILHATFENYGTGQGKIVATTADGKTLEGEYSTISGASFSTGFGFAPCWNRRLRMGRRAGVFPQSTRPAIRDRCRDWRRLGNRDHLRGRCVDQSWQWRRERQQGRSIPAPVLTLDGGSLRIARSHHPHGNTTTTPRFLHHKCTPRPAFRSS
jgi:hypothetical protein